MVYDNLPKKDPRTIARDIPGICDILFPQLTAGTVLYFNKKIKKLDGIEPVPAELVEASSLQQAMLFEIAYARGERLLEGSLPDNWDDYLKIATQRQKRYFDAVIPANLSDNDKTAAQWVSNNMVNIITDICKSEPTQTLITSPEIYGFQWIASGEGDFSIGTKLIEIKCSRKNFGSIDYRQILMYWLLSYAASIESKGIEWETAILINPRLNHVLEIPFDNIISVSSAGKSKIEIIELFASIVGDHALKILTEFNI
jgi:hypothetical protein